MSSIAHRYNYDLTNTPTSYYCAMFRMPRVSFKAEVPFIFGLACVFGLWTKMHHGLMAAHSPNDPDPFTHVKQSKEGDEIDMSFLKELEAEDSKQKKSK